MQKVLLDKQVLLKQKPKQGKQKRVAHKQNSGGYKNEEVYCKEM